MFFGNRPLSKLLPLIVGFVLFFILFLAGGLSALSLIARAHFIRLDRACGMGNSQRILFVATKEGTWTPIDTVLSSNVNPTYLKLVRSGNVFSGYYSADGIVWHHAGDLTFPISDPVDIGLLLVNVYHDGRFYADFDYFNMAKTP